MKTQMTCPFCKKEFPFDNGELDRKIAFYSQKVTENNAKCAEIKAILASKNDEQLLNEKRRIVIQTNWMMAELSKLKSRRKIVDQQISRYSYQIFKTLFREKYGEEAFRDMLDAVQEELKAYEISETMKHEYTRSQSKNSVISINKI